jgi:hypothetical protein
MNEVYSKIIDNSLDSLDKLSIWIFTSFIIALLSILSDKEEISFGPFSIQKKYAGIIIYIMLFSLAFTMFKLLNTFADAYRGLIWLNLSKDEFMRDVNLKIQNHTWVFNPFSKTNNQFSFIIDNIGFPMLIIIWWIGNAIAHLLTQRSSNKIFSAMGLCFAGLYLLLGLGCLLIIQGYMQTIVCLGNPSSCYDLAKQIAPFIGIGIGGLSFFLIVTIGLKKQKKQAQQLTLNL